MTVKLLKKIFFFIVILPGIPYVLGSALLLTYSFWPTSDIKSITTALESAIPTRVEHVVLLAHGLKDSPETWADPLAVELREKMSNDMSAVVIPLDWSAHAQSTFRCSVNADRIGEHLADRFSELKKLQSMHLVAHSCGSFIIHALCASLKQINPNVKIQTTYLDPVSVYGGMRWDYGLDNFGDCADFSEAYIDRDDGIPGSDSPLKNAYTFDVSQARNAIVFDQSPHMWPPFYYIHLSKGDSLLQLRSDPGLINRYPKGESIFVESVQTEY